MPELERIEISRISERGKEIYHDVVATEAEVVIKLDGGTQESLHCLPSHLDEMVKGYLVSEGICRYPDIKDINVERGGDKFIVAATFDRPDPINPEKSNSQAKITTAEVWDAIEKLNESGILFKKTGATHVAGIYDHQEYIFIEDVSRHCAIDKACGLALARGVNLTCSVLITSCRQTESTLRKAIFSQIPIVITNSAPSHLAVKSAREFGIMLIGFARGQRFNIYSHEWRIAGKDSK